MYESSQGVSPLIGTENTPVSDISTGFEVIRAKHMPHFDRESSRAVPFPSSFLLVSCPPDWFGSVFNFPYAIAATAVPYSLDTSPSRSHLPCPREFTSFPIHNQ